MSNGQWIRYLFCYICMSSADTILDHPEIVDSDLVLCCEVKNHSKITVDRFCRYLQIIVSLLHLMNDCCNMALESTYVTDIDHHSCSYSLMSSSKDKFVTVTF